MKKHLLVAKIPPLIMFCVFYSGKRGGGWFALALDDLRT